MKQTNITLDNYEEYIIDFVEHTLPEELNLEMVTFLNLNPGISEEIMSFRNIKLVPDISIQYPDVDALLMKEEPVNTILLWKKIAGLAASIGLLLGAWYMFGRGESTQINNQHLVEHKIEATIELEEKEPIQIVQETKSGEEIEIEPKVDVPQMQGEIISNETMVVNVGKNSTQKPKVVKQNIEPLGPTIKKRIEEKQVKQQHFMANRPMTKDREVIEKLEYLPSILNGIDFMTDQPNHDMVFTVVIPKRQHRLNIIKSKLTGSFAFANTSMAFLPTFINTKQELLNN